MKKELRSSNILIGSLFFIFLFSRFSFSQNLKIYCIDVEQGSSTLLIAGDKSILIDCGSNGKEDSVYNIIKNKANLTSINYFVCTHYHEDHYGALDGLIDKGLTISDKFYDRDSFRWLPESRVNSNDFKEYRRISEGKRKYLRPGHSIPFGNVSVECIVANGRAKGVQGSIEYPSDENGYSIGLIISYNNFDILIA